ncbi:MAG TPA: hypothetical protein VKF81_17230, partial [Blastocatellia bacterium]|nr:hypothetical protein [Blastocatellia bacterium]
MLRRTISIALCVSLWLAAAAQTGHTAQSVVGGVPTAASDVHQQTFDIVWRTVKEKHFDPTLGGVNWDKVREQYAPRAASAKSDGEFYDVLRQMLGELHQSHFNIIAPEDIVRDDSPEPKGGGIGIDLRLVDGRTMITRVESGSKAAAAGLRPGFIVTKVDDTTVDQVIATFAKSKESQAIIKLRITRAVLGRINGMPETMVRITYLDASDQPHEA